MKLIVFLLVTPLIWVACNKPKQAVEEKKTDSVSVNEKLNYAFTPKYSINWQPGDEKEAQMVLQSLKDYCDGKMEESLSAFSDSVEVIFDQFNFKGTRDSLRTLFKKDRDNYSSINVDMDTWLVTYYPDKKDSWVTLWYKQTSTDKKGKIDSVYVVDDLLIKDGKIKILDQKIRRYPKK